jgi:hypothetical protein
MGASLQLEEQRMLEIVYNFAAHICKKLKTIGRTHLFHRLDHPMSFYLEHARQYLELLKNRAGSEPHFQHAATRVLMTLETERADAADDQYCC